MTETYNPLKDPLADGYTFVGATVDLTAEELSKPDWKEPLWVKFKAFCSGFGKAVFWVAVLIACVGLYLGYKNHTSEVSTIQNPPSGSPEMGKSLVKENAKNLNKPNAKKSAPKNEANVALNTPAMPSFEAGKVPVKKTKVKDDFTAEFDRDLSKFETNLKKDFP